MKSDLIKRTVPKMDESEQQKEKEDEEEQEIG
jgi:hypothetical protein